MFRKDNDILIDLECTVLVPNAFECQVSEARAGTDGTEPRPLDASHLDHPFDDGKFQDYRQTIDASLGSNVCDIL